MNLRIVLRIGSVLGLAAVSALLLRGLFLASTAAPPPPPKASIRVAAARLPVGTLLKADDLAWKEVPAGAEPKAGITRNSPLAPKLLGAVVRRPVDEGAVVTDKDVVFPDSPGFLAAALHPDMRAVSVAIDDVSGNAGLILPGDHVDLILTHSLEDADRTANRPKIASETVLADVRVIAVGSVMRVPEADNPTPAANRNARTVTLEVTPHDAESVAVVTRLGHLSLALRSLAVSKPDDTVTAGAEAAPPSAPVWGKDVSAVLRMAADRRPTAPSAAGPGPVQVFRGDGANH